VIAHQLEETPDENESAAIASNGTESTAIERQSERLGRLVGQKFRIFLKCAVVEGMWHRGLFL
jgi:hypothetical protein